MKIKLTILIATVGLVVASGVTSCKDSPGQQAGFTLSREDISETHSKMRGVIYKLEGSAGMYREESTLIDIPNAAGSVRAGEGEGQITESWPATPGFYYEGTAYTNKDHQGLIVIRKVPESKKKNKPEQAIPRKASD